MKKIIAVLVGFLLLGITSLLADGSNIRKNVNINVIKKSKITNSVLGINIDTRGSKITVRNNVNLNIVNQSIIQNSVLGMNIKAR